MRTKQLKRFLAAVLTAAMALTVTAAMPLTVSAATPCATHSPYCTGCDRVDAVPCNKNCTDSTVHATSCASVTTPGTLCSGGATPSKHDSSTPCYSGTCDTSPTPTGTNCAKSVNGCTATHNACTGGVAQAICNCRTGGHISGCAFVSAVSCTHTTCLPCIGKKATGCGNTLADSDFCTHDVATGEPCTGTGCGTVSVGGYCEHGIVAGTTCGTAQVTCTSCFAAQRHNSDCYKYTAQTSGTGGGGGSGGSGGGTGGGGGSGSSGGGGNTHGTQGGGSGGGGGGSSGGGGSTVYPDSSGAVNAIKGTVSGTLKFDATGGIDADLLKALAKGKPDVKIQGKYNGYNVTIAKGDISNAAGLKDLDFTKGKNPVTKQIADQFTGTVKGISFTQSGDFGGVDKVGLSLNAGKQFSGMNVAVYKIVDGKPVKIGATKVTATGSINLYISDYSSLIFVIG